MTDWPSLPRVLVGMPGDRGPPNTGRLASAWHGGSHLPTFLVGWRYAVVRVGTGRSGCRRAADRPTFFGPQQGASERARGGTAPVPTQLVPEGWERFAERVPDAAAIVTDLLAEPSPLVMGLTATPQTLVHGDWKAGNLGSHPDGRTILLDWAIPGIAPGCLDLAWYVCLNRARLPGSKEAAIATYRDGLERHGVDTTDWWDRQLSLSLLGIMLILGWEKALAEADELGWWEQRVLEGVRWLAP